MKTTTIITALAMTTIFATESLALELISDASIDVRIRNYQ